MYTTANLIQVIFISLNLIAFGFLAYKFIMAKSLSFRLFGFSMALLSLVELCVLGVAMLWSAAFVDFKSMQYLFYIYAILMLFSVSATSLRQKTGYYLNIFLAFLALIVTGIFFINPGINNATAYTINYYLSFDNPATVNIFSLTLALSLGMAALIIGNQIKDRTLRLVTEIGFLIVIICLVLNLIVLSDSLRLVASIIQLVTLLTIGGFYLSKDLSKSKYIK